MEPDPSRAAARKPVLIDLALQGGGSHGAFRHGRHRRALLALTVVIALGSTFGAF